MTYEEWVKEAQPVRNRDAGGCMPQALNCITIEGCSIKKIWCADCEVYAPRFDVECSMSEENDE